MNYLITSIIQKEDKLEITFNNKDSFLISKENYFRFDYLYAGKTISQKQFDDLISYEEDEKYRVYLRNLLKKGSYSTFLCQKRLIERKDLTVSKAMQIVSDLVKEGYINDLDFFNNKLEILKYQLLSPKAIIQYFTYEAHISKNIIEDNLDRINEIDEETLYEKVGELLNRRNDLPLKKRKEFALNYLLKKMYSLNYSKNLIDTYIKDNSIEDEINEEYKERIFRKYLYKYDKYALNKKKNAIYLALVEEGLNKDDINSLLNTLNEDENKIYEDADDVYNKIDITNYPQEKKRALFIKKMTNLGYTLSVIQNIIKEKEYDFE